MAKHGKKYIEAAKLVDRLKYYAPAEAVDLLKKTSYPKFDGTVEVHVRLGVDPRHADQQVRSTVLLPAGLGKQVRILVFAEGDAARLAEQAGADYVGLDDLIAKIQGGWLEFDMAIATPQVMGKVGRLGRILGTRGLMPNPKAGTIVQPDDLPRAIREARQGRVEFKVDKTGNLHVPIGKVSFTPQQIMDNLAALMEAIQRAKPSGAKGQYIKRVTLTSTMAPGIRLDTNQALAMKVSAA
ncbi:MAG: 50S ribosomal protein L1 [Anaerolineae bacterium]|nr:50S ribosomal protein L1 [Anaerolineae bacterium]